MKTTPVSPKHLIRRSGSAMIRVVPRRVAHLRALVVGMDTDNLRLVTKILSDVGLKSVSQYPLSATAADKIAALRPDVVLLDWTSNHQEAAALMTSLRHPAAACRPPVIAIVPHITHETAVSIMNTGVDSMVMRPFSPADLYSRIDRATHPGRGADAQARPAPAGRRHIDSVASRFAGLLGKSVTTTPSGRVIAESVR